MNKRTMLLAGFTLIGVAARVQAQESDGLPPPCPADSGSTQGYTEPPPPTEVNGPYDYGATYEGRAPNHHYGFIEGSFGWGFQLGDESYVPTGSGSSTHPLTNGLGVGGSAGWEFLPGLYLYGNYEYNWASPKHGSVSGLLSGVNGSISYSTLAFGLRMAHEIGPGRIFGEFGPALAFPFETHLDVNYDPALATLSTPIVGSGHRVNKYNTAWGAEAAAGYQWDLPGHFYVAGFVRAKLMETTNVGRETVVTNLVTDTTARPPVVVNSTFTYGTNTIPAPSTYSIQDIRFHLAVGLHY